MTRNTKPGTSLTEAWERYEAVVRPYLGDVSVDVLRVTFYAGVAACLNSPDPMRELAEYVMREEKDIKEMFQWRH